MDRLSLIGCFDTIRIINLESRPDRLAQMKGEIDRLGLSGDSRIAFFKAIRPVDKGDFTSVGARGVYESQLAILKEAARKQQSVLILEDDCDFTSDARYYITHVDWDIVYGGYEASNPDDLYKSDIIGAHMMGFSAYGARIVSAYLDKLAYTGIHPPIDGAYVWFRRAHPEVLVHFAQPALAHQRPSRTDIAGLTFYDRWPGLRDLAQTARMVKRAMNRRR